MIHLLLFITIFAVLVTASLKLLFQPIRSWQRICYFSRRLLRFLSSSPLPAISPNDTQPIVFSGPRLIITTGLALLAAVLSLILALPYLPALAEGSRDLIDSGGGRPWLEDQANGVTAGISRTNILKVYANAGETINLGSSAIALAGPTGDILFKAPISSTFSSCLADVKPVGAPADWGRIDNLAEEQAGPLPAAGGYTPCVITVTPATQGIWEIKFVSPNPGSPVNINPPQIAATDPWTQEYNRFWIAAWDITVMNGATSIPGRVFANYLPLNMGGLLSELDSQIFILTNDGYQYRVDLNGQRPFGFIFFGNNVGFINTQSGESLYQSVQLNTGAPLDGFLGTDGIHPPNAPDTEQYITHKIFFNVPDPTLPSSATAMVDGVVTSTWLLNAPQDPPAVTGFSFVGLDGTPGQGGVTQGGNFTFNATGPGNATVVIDLNRNGIRGDGNDRVLQARVTPGLNRIFWDSLDGNGNPVVVSSIPYSTFIRTAVGEVHFPFFDVENNDLGLIIERINGPDAPNTTVYFDDLAVGGNATDPLNGTDSAAGAHAFPINNFGDHKGIDTWAYRAGNFELYSDIVVIAQADLQIAKFAPATVIAGETITYTILVTNAGPSDAVGAPVEDSLPPQVVNATWSCQIIIPGGVCGPPASGVGNISATISLSASGVAAFTVIGRVLPNSSGDIQNTVIITEGLDASDPITPNNTATSTTTVQQIPLIGVAKTASIPFSNGDGTFVVTYTVVVRNYGAIPLDFVQVTENLAPTFSPTATFSIQPPPPDVVGALTAANAGFDGVNDINLLAGTETLPVSGAATITFRVLITPGTNLGPYTNTVTATGTGPNGPVSDISDDGTDPDGNGNGTPSDDGDPTTISFIPPQPRFALVKSALPVLGPGEALKPGDVITYILSYSNTGTAPATGVVITDMIPANTTYEPGSATGNALFIDQNGVVQTTAPATVTGLLWQVGDVPANSVSGEVRFVVRINSILVDPNRGLTVQYSPEGWLVLEGDAGDLRLVATPGPLTVTTPITTEPNPALTSSPTLTPTISATPAPTVEATATPAITLTITPTATEPTPAEATPTDELPTATLTPTLSSEPTVEPTTTESVSSTATAEATPEPAPTEESAAEPPATEEGDSEPASEATPAAENTSTAKIEWPAWAASGSGLTLSFLQQAMLLPRFSFQAQMTPTLTPEPTISLQPTEEPAPEPSQPAITTTVEALPTVTEPTAEPATIAPVSTEEPAPAVSATAEITLTTTETPVPALEAIEAYPIVVLEELFITIDNSAVYDSNEIVPTQSNTTTTPVLQVVDPSLTKETNQDLVVAGDLVDFDVTMSNPSASNAPATEVILTDPVPAYLEVLDYDFNSTPPGLVTGDQLIKKTVTLNGIQTVQDTVVLTVPALAPGEQVFLAIQTQVKNFVQGPLQIRNEAIMEFAEGSPRTDAVTINVPSSGPAPSPGDEGINKDDDDDDNDDDNDQVPAPPPAQPSSAGPVAPAAPPAPSLPVVFLPETGQWVIFDEGTVGRGVLAGLILIGSCLAIFVVRKKLTK